MIKIALPECKITYFDFPPKCAYTYEAQRVEMSQLSVCYRNLTLLTMIALNIVGLKTTCVNILTFDKT